METQTKKFYRYYPAGRFYKRDLDQAIDIVVIGVYVREKLYKVIWRHPGTNKLVSEELVDRIRDDMKNLVLNTHYRG